MNIIGTRFNGYDYGSSSHFSSDVRVGSIIRLDGDETKNHPDNLVALPSQRHHALLEHYGRREEQGVGQSFTLEELLELL